MSFEFAGYQQRSERFQQELDAPMEDVLGATAEQALTESPVFSILRLNELSQAKANPQRIDAASARQKVKDAGLEGRLTVADDGIAEQALGILIDRKKEEVRRQDILSRAPKGMGSGAQQLGMAFAASALDPLNIGLAFVPVVGQARYLRYMAGARGILGRTAVRAGVGAAEGAAGAAIVEPLIYAAKSQEQADYDMQDSLLNVAFGTVFGGGLHVLGGLASDAGKALSPAKVARERIEPTVKFDADSPAARVDAMPLPEREVAMRTAVSQAMTGKAVDVEPVVSKRQMDTPEFRQWFGESKVTDDAGQPLRVYHGTASDFSEFRASTDGSFGPGIYFAKDPAYANAAAKQAYTTEFYGRKKADAAENVVPAFVSIQRPFDAAADAMPAGGRSELIKLGHDGIVSADEVVAFRPEQVKSAIGNSGRFDPNSASLTDARAAAARQVSPTSEVTADVPAATAADRQLAETPKAPDPVAEQEVLLADELLQLNEAARVADIDLGDELAELDEAIQLADEYAKAARAAVLCGMAH